MPVIGNCKLCLEEKRLLKSHLMPQKLYYRGKKNLEFNSIVEKGLNPEELRAPLLCRDCEHLLSVNGENEVLKHVAPKLVLRRFPLGDKMRIALPYNNDPNIARFDARDFGIETDKFAYFALSMVWRLTIHDWDRVIFRHKLGQFTEDMRLFLIGKTTFPADGAVIVIVCSDSLSRKRWTIPARYDNPWLDFAFHVRGIRFRVVMGKFPRELSDANCLRPNRPIFYADCQKRSEQEWSDITKEREANLSHSTE